MRHRPHRPLDDWPPTILVGLWLCPLSQLFKGVTYEYFSTSSSPSLRRLAAYYAWPARGVAPRRAVVHRCHGRVFFRHRPHRLCDGWPPTMLDRLGALPFDAQLSTGFTGERHFGIVLTDFATVGHPPCWVGSGRGPMALSCSLASRTSSLLASSPLSVCRPLCSVGLWLRPSPRSCSLASRT